MNGVKLNRKELDTRPFLEMKNCILKCEKVEYDEPMLPIEKSCFILFSISTSANICISTVSCLFHQQ